MVRCSRILGHGVDVGLLYAVERNSYGVVCQYARHVYIYIHTHTYTHIHSAQVGLFRPHAPAPRTHACTAARACMHWIVHTSIHTYIHTHKYIHTYTGTYHSARLDVHTHTYIHTHIHRTHIHTNTDTYHSARLDVPVLLLCFAHCCQNFSEKSVVMCVCACVRVCA
jgi:hypothetical protein